MRSPRQRSWSCSALAIAAAVVAFWLATAAAQPANGVQAAGDGPPVAPEHFVALADVCLRRFEPGCGAITVADTSNGRVLWRGIMDWRSQKRPARLAATSDARLILATTWHNQCVQVTRWAPSEQKWTEGSVDGDSFSRYGDIAISPDDTTVLVAGLNSVLKFAIANVALDSLGPLLGSAKISDKRQTLYQETTASDILFTSDGKTAYVVADNSHVLKLNVPSMAWQGVPLEYPPVHRQRNYRLSRTFAALSPDEQWLVINTGREEGALGQVTLVDTRRWQLEVVDTPGLNESWGLDFIQSGPNRSVLAAHGRSKVGLYRLMGMTLVPLTTEGIPAPSDNYFGEMREPAARFASLAWSGDGARLIANRGVPEFKEWRLFGFGSGTPLGLEAVVDVDSCTSVDGYVEDHRASMGFDVLTLQKRPTLTPTPVPTDTPTLTSTRRPSPTPTPTDTPVPLSATPTDTPMPSATPTATDVPVPLYLPIAIREHCDPERYRSDIALVVDTSSSMTGAKFADARLAALAFVGMIDLAPGRSQVAVVRYDREAEVVSELTRARSAIEAAIRSLHVRSGTHIDKGLQAALAELQSQRHLDRNTQVLVLLTDGVQTGTPGEELRAAAKVHAAGVRLYAIGVGEDVDEADLKTMAGSDERYYFAPDSGDLARIYGEIATDLMCPGTDLWGGR